MASIRVKVSSIAQDGTIIATVTLALSPTAPIQVVRRWVSPMFRKLGCRPVDLDWVKMVQNGRTVVRLGKIK